MDDFRQRAMAELAKYRGLLLDNWEKMRLLNVVVAPRLMHKALLLGDEEYWRYLDKVFRHSVLQSHGQVNGQMCAKMNRPVKRGGMGLRMTYWMWRA